MILTDAKGRPIPRPEPPPVSAGVDERVAYVRAMAAYNDRVADIANLAFYTAFRKGATA